MELKIKNKIRKLIRETVKEYNEGVSKHLEMYSLLNDLRDEGHLHRYGVTRLQTEFGLSEEEAQEIYNEYKEDLKEKQQNKSLKEEFTSAEQFFNKMSDEEKKEVTSKWTVDGADENTIKSYKEVLNWLRTYVKPTKDLPSDESQKVLDQTIMDYVKEKQQNEGLKEAAIKLGYLSEYVAGGKGHAHVFKTDEDQDKLFDLVRSYVSDPGDAQNITMRFLDDDKARMPDIDTPGFQKEFFDLMNYEIIGIPKLIDGGLDNATIKYKGETYTNVSFEQDDAEPVDYAGHVTMPIYRYSAKSNDVTFYVDVMNDENTVEPQWDEMEAYQSNRR